MRGRHGITHATGRNTPREHGRLNTGHASKHDQFQKQRGDQNMCRITCHRRHLLPTLVSDRSLYKGDERSGGALPRNLDFRSRGFPREGKRMSPPRIFKEVAEFVPQQMGLQCRVMRQHRPTHWDRRTHSWQQFVLRLALHL